MGPLWLVHPRWGSVKAFVAIALIAVSISASAAPSDPRSYWDIQSDFDRFENIVLVTVINSTFPTRMGDAAYRTHATAKVLKSWKGSQSVGATIHIVGPQTCAGPEGSCVPYLAQAGEKLLIFTNDQLPLVALKGNVSRAADSKHTMLVLDEVLEQKREPPDSIDATNAAAWNVLLAELHSCLLNGSEPPSRQTFSTQCRPIKIESLADIRRRALVAHLGPPTWCISKDTRWSRATEDDCAPEQTPIWSLNPTKQPSLGLECEPDDSGRCVSVYWRESN